MALCQTMKQLSRQVNLRNYRQNNSSVVKFTTHKPAGKNSSFFPVHYVQDSVVLDIGHSGHLFCIRANHSFNSFIIEVTFQIPVRMFIFIVQRNEN